MSESYDAEYTRLLIAERDRVRVIVRAIYELATDHQGDCQCCSDVVTLALDALTPPATWDDYKCSHWRS